MSRQLVGSDDRDAWWARFEDPVLSQIEERALERNLGLAEAAERIARGRALLRIAGAALGPAADGSGSYSYARSGATGTEGHDYEVGLGATWVLDFWGKGKRRREAATADLLRAQLERSAARIALSAEVVRVYAQLRNAEERIAILIRSRENIARGEAIAARRYNLGAASRYDAATASAELAAIDAALPRVRRDALNARNALALLCGEEPHALDPMLQAANRAAIIVPRLLPAKLPSEIVRTKPEILAAEAALHSATARIGMAKADFYPTLTLGGGAGFQALQIGDLGGWDSRQFSLGGILRLPIFESGRLRGEVELAEADQRAAAISYRETVLRAWHEIDNALADATAASAAFAAATTGVEQSRLAVHVAERRYAAGASGYLEVLLAERAALDHENRLVEARTAQVVAIADLYRALGSDWQSPSGAAG